MKRLSQGLKRPMQKAIGTEAAIEGRFAMLNREIVDARMLV